MEYQEGQIAEDGQGNFLVYRSGQWFPSQSDGRPLERIPRPDYGANHFQLPNGDIVRQGPRGGQETVENFGGAGGGSGGGALVGADARGRYNIGADALVASARGAAAEEARGGNPLNRDWGAVVLSGIDLDPREGSSMRPFAPLARIIGGQDFQNYDQALATYEASLLPIQSGASVTESEARRQIRADFPQLGESEETVRRKASNRLRRINAVFQGIGREVPFSEEQINDPTSVSPDAIGSALSALGEIDPATGLPSYSGLTRTNGTEIPLTQAGPGSSPDLAVDVSDPNIPRDELVRILSGGGWVRNGQGEPYQVGAGAVRFAQPGEGGRQIRPGVIEGAPETPEQAVAERRDLNMLARRPDAYVRGIADAITFGTADEIAAGLETVLPITGGAAGWTEGFPEAFQRNVARERAMDRADSEDVPVTRAAGQITGAFAGGLGAGRMLAGRTGGIIRNSPRVAGSTAGQTASRIARNTTRQGAIGATGAGLYGFGSAEGDVGERLPEAGQTAILGGVLGPVASKVGESVLTPAAGAVSRAIGLAPRRSALEGAVDRFGTRFNPNPNVLSQQADELESIGIQPAFVDVMDRGQRGLGRALAMRQTPAREAVSEFAEGRAEGLPDAISRQARRTISQDPRSPMEMREATADAGRRAAKPLYEQAYAQPVDVTPAIQGLLNRPAGQAALQRAQRIAANEGQSIDLQNPSMQTLDYVKRGLDDVLESYRDRTTGRLVLDTEGRAIEGVRREFLSELDAINPAYRQARQSYADTSKLQEAVDLGEGFLSTEADEFARRAQALTPEQRALAQASARRAIERGASTSGNAPGVAQRLSAGREQGMRNRALLGEAAEPMQEAMRAERRLVMNARDINPGAGSPTAQNQMDVMETGGNILSAGVNALSGNVRGTIGSLGRLVRLGYSDSEAEAIMMAAIDPAQTRNIINMLAERGLSKEKARNLTRALRYYASQRSGEAAGEQ